MTKSLPVSDADVRAAWDDFYVRPGELAHIPIVSPDPTNWLDAITLAGLRRVLENDRRRVAEQESV